jgi:hypothetical protein
MVSGIKRQLNCNSLRKGVASYLLTIWESTAHNGESRSIQRHRRRRRLMAWDLFWVPHTQNGDLLRDPLVFSKNTVCTTFRRCPMFASRIFTATAVALALSIGAGCQSSTGLDSHVPAGPQREIAVNTGNGGTITVLIPSDTGWHVFEGPQRGIVVNAGNGGPISISIPSDDNNHADVLNSVASR